MTPSDLCTTCGLCCDGTLYPVVKLAPEDDLATLEALGLQVTHRTSPVFRQGCTLLKGTCCSAYESRPIACRRYSCRVLTRLTNGEIAEPDARAMVRKAQRGRDRTRAAFARLVPDVSTMNVVELHAAAPAADALRTDRDLARRWGPAMMQLAWLAELLRAEFRTEKEKNRASPPATHE